LNATKALLLVKRATFSDSHGVTGTTTGIKSSIANENVFFKGGGILAAFCRYLGENANNDKYTLRDLLYNLVYIHRAYNLSVSSFPELFTPIRHPKIVRSKKTDEAWFCAELEGKHASEHTINRLPAGYERDNGIHDRFIVRKKARFLWKPRNKTRL